MKRFPSQLIHYADRVLFLDPKRLLIAFREPIGRKKAGTVINKYGLRFEDEEKEAREVLPKYRELVNHTESRFWVRYDEQIPEALLDELEAHDEIGWIAPVYRRTDLEGKLAYLSPLPYVLMIQFQEKVPRRTLVRIERRYNLTNIEEKTKHLGPFYYYRLPKEDREGNRIYAYSLRDQIKDQEKEWVVDVHFESMPMITPVAITLPNDTHFGQQWTMNRINAPDGWDLSTGVNTVIIGVLDEGCDMTHPDLNFDGPGFNADTGLNDGDAVGDHGTAVAGIAAAEIDNNRGIAGVAGDCRIHSVAIPNWTDVEVAAAINEASNVASVHVINMSFGWNGWNTAIINPAIVNAHNVRGVVLCAATHNHNSNVITYPATHPLTIAVGASDQNDERKRPTSPDGECWWGSNWGAELDVMAPGVLTWTTDRQGAAGYNQNGNPITLTFADAPCLGLGGTLVYPTTGDAGGDYFANFNGTSGATPHVAGLAALLRSLYPTLTNVEVRNIIERTCDKVNPAVYAYAHNPAKPNGTWNNEIGYGRINILRALDFADVMIKDWPGDTGIEPSTPPGGNYWDFSDIVIRPVDDDVFVPSDPNQSARVEKGQTNYLYIEVMNNGPREARNVVVTARITPYVGLSFIYPADWTLVDATHVSPTPVIATFAAIPSGGTARAKFTISPSQVDSLWGWEHGMFWSPCLLAAVNADNDYAFAGATATGGSLVRGLNNLAQRNLSVVDVTAGATVAFPLLAGNRQDAGRFMEVIVDRSRLPRDIPLLLSLEDDSRAFPLVDLTLPTFTLGKNEGKFVFLERTRIEVTLTCTRGVLTLEKGSRFDCPPAKIGKVSVKGGEVIMRDDKRFVEIKENIAVVRIEKQPKQLYPFSLHTSIPTNAQAGQQYTIRVAQRNEKEETVGGATIIYFVKG